jgi:uncharacterized protein YdeI (YjbR/CyaY-like superfamily)
LKKDLPVKRFASRSAWEAWLAKHHETSPGVWLELAKKDSGLKSVSRPDALELALCYGWIDGQAAPVDTKRWRQRFTPRRPRSKWSRINCAAVERLHAEGRVAPAGIRAMEAAKRAERAFAELDSQNRYAILYRLHDAKKADTRQRRLATFIRMLEAGETLHPRK